VKLQFAFGNDDKAEAYRPESYPPNCVVYTGTHDNDTTWGWWNTLAAHERDYVRRYLGVTGEFNEWDLIRAALASVAALAIVPMQDVLGLGSDARMNQPGLGEGYWEWRFSWHQVGPWHAERLAELTRLYGRQPRRRGARELLECEDLASAPVEAPSRTRPPRPATWLKLAAVEKPGWKMKS